MFVFDAQYLIFIVAIILTSNPRNSKKRSHEETELTNDLHYGVMKNPLNPKTRRLDVESSCEHTCKSNSKPVTKEKFVNDLHDYIYIKHWEKTKRAPLFKEKINDLLQTIYDEINDWSELLIFTANAIFATNGFKNMIQKYSFEMEEPIYRGIMQISAERDLQLIAYLMNDDVFVEYPIVLSSFENIATKGSIKFWQYLIQKAKEEDASFVLNFESAFKLLSAYNVRSNYKDDLNYRKTNRLDEYNSIKMLFDDLSTI
ncbi:hypothetical protein H312_01837 [Anncaliia algerae PRA339]|uniref:Uncharacterized protein n=1 Tax=Anncaliia algerae PRA339 TaxID=1288291 RepID=A0A059F0B2_9MICR|nr:hypothetical protein H312_01837 [Anncaliia algerae PRA339]